MKTRSDLFRCACLILLAIAAVGMASAAEKPGLPPFGRDTVLVWKIENMEFSSNFVVRIAQFLPDRFVEWEDEQTQGMIFMPGSDIQEARGFVNSGLFKSGGEARGKKATTLWLSRQIYRELKQSRKTKCMLDGVQGSMKYLGEDQIEVQVNRSPVTLPVIKVSDDRGSERWFLDTEDNPLMVVHKLRNFNQTLSSITTDKANTLRWIKGKKLPNSAGSY